MIQNMRRQPEGVAPDEVFRQDSVALFDRVDDLLMLLD
jgi:hypothetical protein